MGMTQLDEHSMPE